MIFASGHSGVSHEKYVGVFEVECVIALRSNQECYPDHNEGMMERFLSGLVTVTWASFTRYAFR
jgi:hypothetical protein